MIQYGVISAIVIVMNDENATIAALRNREGQDFQPLLVKKAAAWAAMGVKVAGLIAERTDEGGCSAGFLRDLASGERFVIRLDNAPSGTTCRLDAHRMDEACEALLPRIAAADLVIISKFGKLEAGRQGLWRAFSTAVDAGKPLLTTVSAKHVEAWTAFAPGAVWLRPDDLSIEDWMRNGRS